MKNREEIMKLGTRREGAQYLLLLLGVRDMGCEPDLTLVLWLRTCHAVDLGTLIAK
jgi:hypothetical protein